MAVPASQSAAQSSHSGSGVPLAARRHPLIAEVEHRLFGSCAVREGERALLAVSGGPDSVALTLACATICGRQSARLTPPVIAHVNHHLRPDADADEAWVVDFGRALGLPVRVESVYPGDLPGNTMHRARHLRYEALTRMAREEDAQVIMTAHHADDQLETVLMALGRGAGIDGLSGMRWIRPLDESVRLVRPLLATTKQQCVDLCTMAGMAWREDPGNADPTRVRGRLRRDVSPVLESLWPGVARRVAGTTEILALAGELLERELECRFGSPDQRQWSRDELAGLTPALLAAGLRRAAVHRQAAVSDQLDYGHAMQVAEAIVDHERRPRRFDWPGGMQVHVTAHTVTLTGPAG